MLKIRQQTIDQSLQKRFQPRPQKKRRPKKRKAAVVAKRSSQIKRTTFNRTPLGDFLIRYCPMEYELINKAKSERLGINADLVETIAYHSDNPAFRSVEFRKALTDYRKYRCRTPNKVQFSLDNEIAAIKYKLKINQ